MFLFVYLKKINESEDEHAACKGCDQCSLDSLDSIEGSLARSTLMLNEGRCRDVMSMERSPNKSLLSRVRCTLLLVIM